MSVATETEPIVGELIVVDVKSLPITFNVTEAMLAELKVLYSGLTIVTKEDYELAKTGKRTCVKFRTGSDARKDELIRPALDYQEQVRSVHKSIHAAVREVEDSLEKEIAKYDEIEKARKRKLEAEKQAMINERVQAFLAVGATPNYLMIQAWADEEFTNELEAVTRLHAERKAIEAEQAAESARIAAEQAEALRVEQEKLVAERAELERLRAEEAARQKAEADKRRAEQEAIEKQHRAEREELDRERQALKEKLQAVERAEFQRQEAIRLEREAAEKAEFDRLEAIRVAEEKAELAEAEAKRIEAIKPDAEKLKAFGDMLRLLPFPEMATDEGKEYLANAVKAIKNTADYCCEAFV